MKQSDMNGGVAEMDGQTSVADHVIKLAAARVVARTMPRKLRRKQSGGEPRVEAPLDEGAVLVPSQPARVIVESEAPARRETRHCIAVFCFEDSNSGVGAYVRNALPQLIAGNTEVHVFCRGAFDFGGGGVHVHPLGDCADPDLIARAHEYGRRARAAFVQAMPLGASVALLGHEWASIPILLELRQERGCRAALSLHSVERQRSDMSSDISRRIDDLERRGLETAESVLVHGFATEAHALKVSPACAKRIIQAAHAFPMDAFSGIADAGEIKARVHVGPIDPMILFVGELDERHGPDIAIKSIGAVLRHHPQARFVFVGDGPMQWPLRVHSRYAMLDHAVRIAGHIEGKNLFELVQAADVVVVPSRERTENWPVLAAWASQKPVLATHDAAGGLVDHMKDGVLIYPTENSCVWGIERLLNDENLRRETGRNGHAKLKAQFGWSLATQQLKTLVGSQAQTTGTQD